MRALVLKEYEYMACEDVPTPEPGPNDVLVELKACGICGSDVHGMDGSTGRRRPPLIMGHEAAGVITEVGGNVKDWRKGQRVTFDSTVYCGECWFCRRGETNLCERRQVLGVSCEEYRREGAYAEFVSVPERTLYALPDGVSFPHAAMVEPAAVAAHAVRRTPARPQDTALVVGAGVIGLLMVQLLCSGGCERVIAADIRQERLDLAAQLGAEITLNPQQCDVAEEARKLTKGRGADVAYEAVGYDLTVNTALRALRKGGAISLVGNLSSSMELPLVASVAREITLNGCCASCGEFPAALEMIADGSLKVDTIISAVAPLSEGPVWFERLHKTEPGLVKVILVP